MKLVLTLAILITSLQNVLSQSHENPVNTMEDLVGIWKSHIDEKYRDHPMIKRFNPDLKSQLMIFKWGERKKVIHMSIYNLDRPKEKDTTLLVSGLVVPNTTTRDIKMVDYNSGSNALYKGTYQVDEHGNIVRLFESCVSEGESRRFKEWWKWIGKERKNFEWHTYHYSDSEFKKGDVVVLYSKIE